MPIEKIIAHFDVSAILKKEQSRIQEGRRQTDIRHCMFCNIEYGERLWIGACEVQITI